MSGLVAAARLRELGRTPQVREKGTRIGGSMLLSSCVIWRHREWSDFRAECPTGDERLQRLVYERLDDALDWLEPDLGWEQAQQLVARLNGTQPPLEPAQTIQRPAQGGL
jgi:hypothetical protein